MKNYTIIPQPVYFEIKGDVPVFRMDGDVCFEGKDETENSINELRTFLKDFFDLEPSGMGRTKIRMEIEEQENEEGYSIVTEKDRVVLKGHSERGLFYAVQTLKQLLFCGEGDLPELKIKDYPRFPVRGFMLDCGRYFFTVEAVKQFIDMMALHKLNEFHWHLSEDQGFRCQLERKLLLTEIGSHRVCTNFNNKPHQGYYTKEDMLNIIEYAHSKYIKVVPEIDTPGHVMSILSAYPELACFPREFTVSNFWGVKHDVFCIGKETTFLFMQELLDELTEIFTDGVVHLGGDEVPTVRWKICPECQRRMKEEGLTDERELHTYYIDRIAAYLRNKGIDVRMWNNTTDIKKVDNSVAWQLWNGGISIDDVVRELNGGRKFVISCAGFCYLDLPYAITNLEKCYNFEPAFDGLDEQGKNNLLGIEACLWTEFVPDMLTADKMTYPRLAAISETAWTPAENKNFGQFYCKLESYYKLLRMYGIKPASLKSTLPGFAGRLAGKIYWERRKLCWGAHQNIISDFKAKKARRFIEN